MVGKLNDVGLAGGCAGAASRTVVSPLERLKIILCVLVAFIIRVMMELTLMDVGSFTGRCSRGHRMGSTRACGVV